MEQPFILRDAVSYQDGAIVSKEILKTGHGTVTLFAFDVGQGLSEHISPFQVRLYVLDGEAEVTIAGEKQTISKGAMITLPADQPHAVAANKRFKMLLIMIK